MQFNLKNSLKVHNRYELQLRDKHTGQLKQKAYAENVVLDNMWKMLGQSSASSYTLNMFYGVRMGTGAGEPNAADTNLFTQAFEYVKTFTSVSREEKYPTCTYVYKVDIPAISDYVGALTEIGLVGNISYNDRKYLWTHAILKDSEGNPIVINKTDLDILTITATIYVTFGTTDENFHWFIPGANNAICQAFRTTSGQNPFNSIHLGHCSTLLLNDDGYIISVTVPEGASVGSETYSSTDKILGVTNTRLLNTAGNTRYYQGMVLGNSLTNSASYQKILGGIIYPNSNVFPNFTLAGMRIGTGDGVTTNFKLPLPYILPDTDKIYVDGVLLQRGVDYTIDPLDSAKDYTSQTSNFLIDITDTLEPFSDIPDIPEEWPDPKIPIERGHESSNRDYVTDTIYATVYDIFSNQYVGGKNAILMSHKPHIYKCTCNEALNKFNHIQLNDFAPYSGNYEGYSVGYGAKFIPPIWFLAVYDETPAVAEPVDLGLLDTTANAARALLDMYYADPQSVPQITQEGDIAFWDQRLAVGYYSNPEYSGPAEGVYYRALKYVNGTALMGKYTLNNSIAPRYIVVTLPGSEENVAKILTDAAVRRGGSSFKYIIPQTTRDLSFLEGREELCDLTPVNCQYNGKYIYPNTTGNYRSYVVKLLPRRIYTLQTIAPGDTLYVTTTATDPRTASDSYSSTRNTHVSTALNSVVTIDLRNYSAPQYLVITYTATAQTDIVYSVKDVTGVDPFLYGRANLDFTPNSSGYDVYYQEFNVPSEEAHPGWSTEIVLLYQTISYAGCKLIFSGSDSAQGPWTPIYVKKIPLRDAYTYASYRSDTYMVHDLSADCPCYSYAYYRAELDISEATDPRFRNAQAIAVAYAFDKSFSMEGRLNGQPSDAPNITIRSISTLKYLGDGIQFTNPPAEGAIITMDGDIDRPYKNENFALDASMSLHFGGV